MTTYACNKCTEQFNTAWLLKVHKNQNHKKSIFITHGTECLIDEEDQEGPDRLIEVRNTEVKDHKVLLFEYEITEIYKKMASKKNDIVEAIINTFIDFKTINGKFTMKDGAHVIAFRTDNKDLINKLKEKEIYYNCKIYSRYFNDIEIKTTVSYDYFKEITNIINYIEPDKIEIGISPHSKKDHKYGRLLNVKCEKEGATYQWVLAPLMDISKEDLS